MENIFLHSIGFCKRYNENLLSDIVRAQCLCDQTFLEQFFKFCFPSDTKIKVYAIDRETVCSNSNDTYTDENSNQSGRNDFKIYTSDSTYIIESKILDTNISKSDFYINCLNGKSDKLTYIISKNNSHYTLLKKGLSSRCIKCVCWEDFIEKIKKDYNDFTILATSILNYSIQKPKLESLSKKKELCDNFFNSHLKNEHYDEKGGNIQEWDEEKGYAYGYTIWASVWFGLLWSPLKKVFWGFAYGEDGDKEIDESKMDFKNIKPLGYYMKDGFFYYEIVHQNDINIETLESAFKEFAEIIRVKEGNEKIPLIEYIKNYGANI